MLASFDRQPQPGKSLRAVIQAAMREREQGRVFTEMREVLVHIEERAQLVQEHKLPLPKAAQQYRMLRALMRSFPHPNAANVWVANHSR
jgi:hypothetical protein